MKLSIDMLSSQVNKRWNEIDRYLSGLIRGLHQEKRNHTLSLLVNANCQEGMAKIRNEFIFELSRGNFIPYYLPDFHKRVADEKYGVRFTSSFAKQAYERQTPDILLYPYVSKGISGIGVDPFPSGTIPSAKRAAILYDFYPNIIDPQDPAAAIPAYKKLFHAHFENFSGFDLILTTSESIREIALEYLRMPEHRIANISMSIGARFLQPHAHEDRKDDFLNELGIRRPYVFFPGQLQPNNGSESLIRAFSLLGEELISKYQLAVLSSDSSALLNEDPEGKQILKNNLVVTGHVPEQELKYLYSYADLVVIPSAQDGFILPVLEGMACGAPVIAPDNPLIHEFTGAADCLFNLLDVEDLRKKMAAVLENEDTQKKLISQGLELTKSLSWQKTAQSAWNAFEALIEDNSSLATLSVSKKRKKIAFITPIPPQHTGIAAYFQDLLRILRENYDIEIFTDCDAEDLDGIKVNNWKELIDRNPEFDVSIYQIGNSEFHNYMIGLLRKVPGIVVLHDFFLGDLKINHYASGAWSRTFAEELLTNHGVKAVVDYFNLKPGDFFSLWPVNYDILKYAIDIIIHSRYQADLFGKYYPNGWTPSPRIIKQPIELPSLPRVRDKASLKARLGFMGSEFLICSFGLVNPHKLPDVLVGAFKKVLQKFPDCRLVFVGAVGQDRGLVELIDREASATKSIAFTGHVSDEVYKDYLIAADAAIQLRYKSRGETSRAVLDCLAYGLPVIMNDNGSLGDFQDEVIRISESPSIEELAEKIESLLRNPNIREEMSVKSRRYIEEQHSKAVTLREYGKVIDQASAKTDRQIFAPIKEFAKNVSNTDWLNEAVKAATNNLNIRSQPRLLIDVTYINLVDLRTGIQRVVKNVIKELIGFGPEIGPIELVRMFEGKLYRASRFSEKQFSLPPQVLGEECEVLPNPGDTLFLLDMSIGQYDQFTPIFSNFRRNGGRVATMVYDLIPIKHPETCHEGILKAFRPWIDLVIKESDDIICISQSVAHDVESYKIKNNIIVDHPIRLSFVHLGSDISPAKDEASIREEVRNLQQKRINKIFLMVGTVEPRKGHEFVLDAFEKLWDSGQQSILLILGKAGWNIDHLIHRIKTHKEAGKRLVFIENPSDAEINLAYSYATSLIAASIDEGFGLPIVEAALHNIPTIASDIPVFHEIGGEGVIYFSLQSPESFVDAIKSMSSLTDEQRLNLVEKIKPISWKECASDIVQVLFGDKHIKYL